MGQEIPGKTPPPWFLPAQTQRAEGAGAQHEQRRKDSENGPRLQDGKRLDVEQHGEEEKAVRDRAAGGAKNGHRNGRRGQQCDPRR